MKNAKSLKKNLKEACAELLHQRWSTVQNRILSIQESLLSETKSSAGDKHETGRALLQLEREKAGAQLAEIEKSKQILAKVDLEPSTKVSLGSLVITSDQKYYISISIGAIKVEDNTYYAISTATPIGKLLLGKSKGETITFRNKPITIEAIF